GGQRERGLAAGERDDPSGHDATRRAGSAHCHREHGVIFHHVGVGDGGRRGGGDRLSRGALGGGGVRLVHAGGDAAGDDLQRYGGGARYELQLPREGGGCGGQRERGLAGGERDDVSGHHAAERAGKPDSNGGKRDTD